MSGSRAPGPGDPGLLTLDALAGLAQADVIVHDALVDKRVLALAASAGAARIRRQARRQAVGDARPTSSKRLIELARAGQRVLRLKGGDPFVFGRGGEEALALAAAGIPFRVIPGVTAGLAALAAASIPGHAARHQPRGHLRRRPWRRRRLRLGAARPHRRADRALHGDAQSRADRRRVDARRARAHNAGGRDRRRRPRPKSASWFRRSARVATDAREQAFEPPAIVVVGDIVAVRDRLLGTGAAADKRAAMTARGFIIAAPHSGAGKTTITLALLAALRAARHRGARGQGGPDYIDPAFHAAATGAASVNLDSWAMPPSLLDALAADAARDADILVIEGVMGLFDGVPGSARPLAARPPISPRAFGCRCSWCSTSPRQAQSAAAVVRGFAAPRSRGPHRWRHAQPGRQRTPPDAGRRRHRRVGHAGARRAAARRRR